MIVILFAFSIKQRGNHKEKLDNREVSSNLVIEDETINFLYERYHLEDGLKFTIAGSDIYKDSYAVYYSKDKVIFDDFPDIYKSYILLDLINYQDDYDNDRECYRYSLQEFKDTYLKYYGSVDNFEIDTKEEFQPHFYLSDEEICISSDDSLRNNYSRTVDTYIVNSFYQDDEIIIYERVAFIKINGDKLEFYSDYKMKDKVYTMELSGVDTNFMNNSKVVSNVLINYQDEFPIYEYTYVKGENTYYLESINR